MDDTDNREITLVRPCYLTLLSCYLCYKGSVESAIPSIDLILMILAGLNWLHHEILLLVE